MCVCYRDFIKFHEYQREHFVFGAVSTNLRPTVPDSVLFEFTSESGIAGTKLPLRTRFEIQGPKFGTT